MNRTVVNVLAIAAVALSVTAGNDAEAQNCNPPPGAGENVAWAWGANSLPAQVQNLTGVTAIAGGSVHSLALKTDCTVWAWGGNDYGQLGDGTTIERHVPVQVQNLTGVTAIAGGDLHSLALKTDGTVWAWGRNDSGQLGDGTNDDRLTPVPVLNLSGITAIAAGDSHNLALKSDGTLWAWGWNRYGQLAEEPTSITDHRNTPVQVQNLIGATAIAAGAVQSLAVMSDGTVWAWGADVLTRYPAPSPTPVQVASLSGVKAVAVGNMYSLALKSDGTVWAWGRNDSGQLGDGTDRTRPTPVQVLDVSGALAIAAKGETSLALRPDAIVQVWGSNDSGLLGDPTIRYRLTPLQVRNLVENLSEISAIGLGKSRGVVAGHPLTVLSVRLILVHPDHNYQRLFNLKIDGVVVRANVNGGSSGPQPVSPGNHTVSQEGARGTPLSAFSTVIGGDCAADGTVNLALGDRKTCTITNYDNAGGCSSGLVCCEPGTDVRPCRRCARRGRCP
jgi:hypothetical protein